MGTVQVLTVNAGGGTFSLGGVTGISPDVDITTLEGDIAGIDSSYAGVQVTKNPQPVGNVYTIFLPSSAGTVAALSIDGTSLTARDEVQQIDVVNAHSGTFTLSFGGQTISSALTYDPGTSSPSASSVQSALDALSSISAGGGAVHLCTGGDTCSTGHYVVHFDTGPLAGTNVGHINSPRADRIFCVARNKQFLAASSEVPSTSPILRKRIPS